MTAEKCDPEAKITEQKNPSITTIQKIAREVFRSAFDLVLVISSYFVPKDADTYLFTSHHGDMFKGNPRYLYKYFDGKKKVVWIVTKKSKRKELNQLGINAVHTLSPEGIRATLRAKYLFVDNGVRGPFLSGTLAFLGRFKVIQTWHGSGWKNIALLDNKVQGIERLFAVTTCKAFTKILASAEADQKHFQESFKNTNVTITGTPRNDIFINKDLRYMNYNDTLSLSKYNKVILYAPTFRENYPASPFSLDFLDELDKFLVGENYIMLIKRHPSDSSLKIPIHLKGIRDVTADVEDIQELLVNTDILITDYSSISVDFALTARPIIFYTYDMDRYLTECRSAYYDIREKLTGPFAYTEGDLLSLVKDMSWFENTEYKKEYKQFIDLFHRYKDGRSCERVEELLVDL